MLTTRPYLRFTMCGATARQHRNWLVRLTFSTRSHSSTGYSTVGTLTPATPALLTSTSILPRSASALAVARSIAAASETSTGSFAEATSQMRTVAPDASSRSTIAAPMPWPPPVTTAKRPLRSSRFMASLFHRPRHARDVILDEEGIQDRNRQRAEQRARHQRAPVVDVAFDEFGDHPDRHRLVLR